VRGKRINASAGCADAYSRFGLTCSHDAPPWSDPRLNFIAAAKPFELSKIAVLSLCSTLAS
jgi:hypothetical protein